jgi:ubiquinone/menaquinone biosynthesis C-methylase UbiE
MTEKFRPIKHDAPDSFIGKIKFYLRMVLDLQFASVYRHLKPLMRSFNGKVLDVGAGNSPFEHLLNKNVDYVGLDIKDSNTFDYQNKKIVHYDGKQMPFDDSSFEHLICTEVLEHVAEPGLLISEVHRILKPDGTAIFTIPWSARFHYKPYDYHRYTPSMLTILFTNFKTVNILPRGTDISAIVSKVIVLYFRSLTSIINKNPLFILTNILVCIVLLPVLIVAIPIGFIATLFNIGSKDDPLGYTVILKK